MKSFILSLIILLVSVNAGFSQGVTLGDMLTLASYENWSDANILLINKGWEYYSSEGSSGFSNHSVTWTFDKNQYNDAAVAWATWSQLDLILYKTPYVILQVHNINTYKSIHNAISSYGFKFEETKVEKGEAKTYYKSEKYTLVESTSSSNSSSYYNSSTNIYIFEIYMNYEYSPSQNGFKKVYFEDSDQLKATYTLVKGKMHGVYSAYNEKGDKIFEANYINDILQGKYFYYNPEEGTTLKCSFVNGKKDGPFTFCDKNGRIISEGFFKQDSLNGKRILYDEDSRITQFQNYSMGTLNGPSEYYTYYGDTAVLVKSGNYKNGFQDGKWFDTFSYLKSKKVISSLYVTYKNGEYNGFCEAFTHDSLIYANYINGELNGKYKQFFDINHSMFGGVPLFDSSKCEIQSEGWYEDGKKEGYWKHYGLGTGLIREDGFYKNGLKEGVWNVYNVEVHECKTLDSTYTVDFGHLLLRKESYRQGWLDGPTYYYYSIDTENYKCKNIHTPDDSCYKATLSRVEIKINYKNGKMEGEFYHKDENGAIVSQGLYSNGEKVGQWRQPIVYEGSNIGYSILNYSLGKMDGKIEYFNSIGELWIQGYFKEGIENGEWTYYNNKIITHSKTFKNGDLHGPSRYYDDLGVLNMCENYINGALDSIAVYDAMRPGAVTMTHKILSKTGTQYLSRIRKITGDTTEIQTQSIIDNEYGWDSEGTLNGSYSILLRGRTIIQGQYVNGYKDGIWNYYLYDQGIYVASIYRNDVLQTERVYSISTKNVYKGKVKLFKLFSTTDYEVFSVKDGKRNGTTTIYKNSEKVGKVKYKNGVKVE